MNFLNLNLNLNFSSNYRLIYKNSRVENGNQVFYFLKDIILFPVVVANCLHPIAVNKELVSLNRPLNDRRLLK